MGLGILLLIVLPLPFAVVCLVAALILRLVEWACDRPAGAAGSVGLLLWALALCSPLAWWLEWGFVSCLFG
jgi:hypothetical protein